MTLTIELTPEQAEQLESRAKEQGLQPSECLSRLVLERLDGEEPLSDNSTSIALLESWIAEDATDDPQEIAKAERELAEFKKAMNASRRAVGARILYP